MVDEAWLRAGLLLGPGIVLAALWVALRPRPRAMTAALLALLWNIPFVLLTNVLASTFGWWSFAAGERSFFGVPLEVLLGWSIFWGPVAALALARLNLVFVVLAFAWIDLVFMPRLAPLVSLGDRWLVGEVVALALCLVPAQMLARDTAARENLWRRAGLQGIGYGAWLLFLVPAALADYAGVDFLATVQALGPARPIANALAFVLLIGLAALHEFAAVGGGTPIPFDPPLRLVVTGPYAYLANPMQVTSIAAMLLLAALFGSWSFVAMAASYLIYCVGFVRWHHGADIARRFGGDWRAYRAAVPDWRPRWRPYVARPATLFVAEACATCQDFAAWLRRLHPVGLEIIAGEDHPNRDLEWITYRHGDGQAEEVGIAAIARALEHTNLALAVPAWLIRLPGLVQFAQLLLETVMEKPMGTCVRRKRA